jgi:geranylgeranyl reductase family protein
MKNYEIIIVGAGPAGTSTALQLAALDPNLPDRVLLLDKAVFPRTKLCAGGITNSADKILEQLRLNVESHSIQVHSSKFVVPTGALTLKQESHFRIVKREEFDYQLFQTAQRRGITTREGEAIESINFNLDKVTIRTSKNEYSSKIIIGADGANSVVRRLLGLSRASRIMRAIEIYAPLSQVSLLNLNENSAIFDFTVTAHGIPGYCWIFPANHTRRSMVSLGIIESSFHRSKSISLKHAFENWLARIIPTGNHSKLQAHPALQYEPRSASSQYRALLVGDAAGIDPLFGEGITSALALGRLAAQCSYQALHSNDFSFSDYEKRISSSPIGNMMRRRRAVARRLYIENPLELRRLKFSTLLDWVTPMSPRDVPATVLWESSSSYSPIEYK